MGCAEVSMTIELRPKNRNGVPAEVHALLTLWGNFTRRERHGPQGYPKESPFIQAALYGKLGIPQQSNVRVEEQMPHLVEWMETIVSKMPEDPKAIIEMQYKPYLTPSGNEPSFEEKARTCGVSVSTFRSRLEGAQWYVYAKMYP